MWFRTTDPHHTPFILCNSTVYCLKWDNRTRMQHLRGRSTEDWRGGTPVSGQLVVSLLVTLTGCLSLCLLQSIKSVHSDSAVSETSLVWRDTGLFFLGSGELSACRPAHELTLLISTEKHEAYSAANIRLRIQLGLVALRLERASC